MKKSIIILIVVILIASAFLTVCLYRASRENDMLKTRLEEESLYKIESKLWKEYHKNCDEEYFMDLFHGTEIKDGKLAVYFYLPEGKEEAWLTGNVEKLLSGHEDKITLFFYDIDMIRDFYEDFKVEINENEIYYMASTIAVKNGHLRFFTNEAWFSRLIDFSKQYSHENKIMLDIETIKPYRPQ